MIGVSLFQKSHCTALAFAAFALASCAVPSSYMGISLHRDAAPAELQELARQAKGGNKRAQLELGTYFESGHLVSVNLEKAAMLYQKAAAATPITQTQFTSNGKYIVTEKVSLGTENGLEEAKKKLTRLLARQQKAPDI